MSKTQANLKRTMAEKTESQQKKAKTQSGFGAFLQGKTVYDLLGEKKRRPMVTLVHSETVEKALKVLQKEKIQSAPVVLGASILDNESGDFLGIIDASEILRKLCRETSIMEDVKTSKSKKLNSDERVRDFEDRFRKICSKFWQRKLIQVCGQDVTLLPTVYMKTDLRTLVGSMLFDKDGRPIHRVALLDGTEATSIVTQSDVVKYLHQHKKEMGKKLETKIEDLAMYTPNKVVCVTSDMTAMEAFHIMFNKNLSCVGITNDDGVLIGNLSASDLRGLDAGRFSSLFMSVGDFLRIAKALSRPFATVLKSKLNDLRTITVPIGSTFESLLDLLVKNRVHRAYVVDKKFMPVGLITLSDVLAALIG